MGETTHAARPAKWGFQPMLARERADSLVVMEAHMTKQDGATFDVIVIGGSQAGLAVGYHLARRGLRFVILDAGSETGHVWRSRWDSLTLFTPAQYSGLPGMTFPSLKDTYPSKDDVASYLQAYVSAF